MEINVLEYGAIGDGRINDKAAIQKAVDTCAEMGGGRVVFPGERTYRSGSIVLRTNVEIYLEEGAVLKGSDSLSDYNLFGIAQTVKEVDVPTYQNCDYNGKPAYYFLYAKDETNIKISGKGIIDGNEEIFYGTVTKWHIEGAFYPRVPLLYLENVEGLKITEVTLTHSAFWTVHLVGCREVLIDGIRILNNLRLANCDGIDPDHCQNVKIRNCHIESADDCIVFKNTAGACEYGPCENVEVENCTLMSTSAAIKLGTESEAAFRNIRVSKCKICSSNRGISIQLRDSGRIENITFSDIDIKTRMFHKQYWWGEAEPIAITAVKRYPDTIIGSVQNISFENIKCSGENGILIYGDSSKNIGNIIFKDVSLHLKKETDWPKCYHDLRPNSELEIIEDSLRVLYVCNAHEISFVNCRWNLSEDIKTEVFKPIYVESTDNLLSDLQEETFFDKIVTNI